MGAPKGSPPQECLLDTGSSTLAFCDASIASSMQESKSEYMSCNKYGSGNEGYWGFFYDGTIQLGAYEFQSAHYAVMQQQVEMTCGDGLQGIFGVAFKQLDTAVQHSESLTWKQGGVGDCPAG